MKALITMPSTGRRTTLPRGFQWRAERMQTRCGRRIVIAPASPIGTLKRPGGMRRNSGTGALGVSAKASVAANPRIEITPTPAQYEQLCRDLVRLRSHGAASNTAAILEAVSNAAAIGKVGRRSKKTASKRLPRAKARR